MRHRPLLWLAPAVVLGCAGGASWADAAATSGLSRESPTLLWPLLPAGAAFLLAWRWWNRSGDLTRGALFLGVFLVLSTCAARRVLPPRGDVSELASSASIPTPNKPVPVVLEGWVADHPRQSDFALEFPLECSRAGLQDSSGKPLPGRFGRVWVEAPLDAAIEVGDAVRLRGEMFELPRHGNPGERSGHLRYIVKGCWCLVQIKAQKKAGNQQGWASNIVVTRTAERYPLARFIASLRRDLPAHYERAFDGKTVPPGHEALQRPYPHATAQLLAAMVFGEGGLREPLPRRTRDEFRAAGLSHVLVASGTQVAYLALLLLGLARLLGLRRWWLLALVLPALVFYALLAGGAASIWRATVGGACLAAALMLGRDTDGLSLWSLALGVLLIIDPVSVFDLSLQLSFAATWGLLALAPALRRILARRLGNHVLTDLAAFSLGAQMATMPITLFHFGRLSLVGVGANLVGVPLAGVLVASGLAGLVLPLANVLNYPLTQWIAGVATQAAASPGAQVETPPLGLSWTLCCYGALLLAVAQSGGGFDGRSVAGVLRNEAARWWEKQRARAETTGNPLWRWQTWIVGAVLIATGVAAWRTFAGRPDRSLRLALLDVGQGEAIVIHSGAGRAVLIDGGTVKAPDRRDVGQSVIVPYLHSIGVTQLDALILTHADADHCNGLPFVLREVPVKMVIDGAAARENAAQSEKTAQERAGEADYLAVRALLAARRVPVYPARAGQRLHLGGGATLQVLAPLSPQFPGDNDNAAVLRLEHGQTSVLLTGDIERPAEERLVRRGLPLRCTVLKVAHHGSKTSTSPLFLKASHPKAAILSSGRYNDFGHPAPPTLQRLSQAGIPVFRTDRHGAIEIFSDSRQCWIQTYK